MNIITIAKENGVSVGFVGSLLMIYYDRTPTIFSVRTLDTSTNRIVSEVERMDALVVIAAGSRTPDTGVRRMIQKIMQRFENRTATLAYTVLGDGFGNAAARAAISGSLLFVKPRYPAKVFADVRTAVRWLQAHGVTATEPGKADQLLAAEAFCANPGVSQPTGLPGRYARTGSE